VKKKGESPMNFPGAKLRMNGKLVQVTFPGGFVGEGTSVAAAIKAASAKREANQKFAFPVTLFVFGEGPQATEIAKRRAKFIGAFLGILFKFFRIIEVKKIV
jgi:hypothetical protein